MAIGRREMMLGTLGSRLLAQNPRNPATTHGFALC
jgi:hypothetical protein